MIVPRHKPGFRGLQVYDWTVCDRNRSSTGKVLSDEFSPVTLNRVAVGASYSVPTSKSSSPPVLRRRTRKAKAEGWRPESPKASRLSCTYEPIPSYRQCSDFIHRIFNTSQIEPNTETLRFKKRNVTQEEGSRSGWPGQTECASL